jgi:autotransporter adhesin
MACGTNATALGVNSVALGTNATVGGLASGAVAIGAGSQADAPDTVSFGTALPNGQRRLVNIADGVNDGDAVTIRQYDSLGDAVTALALFAGFDTGAVISLDARLDNLEDGSAGLVRQASPTAPITVGGFTGGTVVSLQNQNGANRTLSGVANGAIAAGGSQAVTGDQLDSVADALGGSQTLAGGRLSVAYTLSGSTYTNVGDALGGLDTRVTTNTTAIDTLNTTVNTVTGNVSTLTTNIGNGTIGLVQRNGATGAITVANTFGGTRVDFSGTDGARVLGGVASGVAATDAVNLGQLTAALTGVGGYAPVAANNSSALANPIATGVDALAVGYGSSAAGSNGFAAGTASQASGSASTAIGASSVASGQNSAALGQGSVASGTAATALGQAASASGSAATASGASSVASAANASAYGAGAQATFAGATAIGSGARASADPTTAVGFQAAATGDNASAFGGNALASAADATAIGQGSIASATGATAIGQGARATRANQVALGGAGSTYTLAGLPSSRSRAAQGGPTEFVTTDRAGNLASTPLDLSGLANLGNRVDAVESGLVSLTDYAVESRRESRKGVAAAMAMTTAPMPSLPGRTSWAVNGATFRGEYGFGASLAHRLDTVVPMALTAGYAFAGDSNHGVRLGVAGEF